MNLGVGALLLRSELILQASLRPKLALLRLSRPAFVTRAASTSVTRLEPQRQQSRPTPDERLTSLRSAEKRIAVLAAGSLVVGYITLKVAFSDLASSKKMTKHEKDNSGSSTGMGSHRPLVLAGPSGSGKSTLLRLLFDEFPDTFGFSVSHTTRSPRSGEKDGREYHFTSRDEMKKSVESGNFIEWAEFSGNMYGTSKQSVRDVQSSGMICVLDIDIQGVRSMKKTDLNPLYVFIKPPSIEELEKRLRLRKTESEESLQSRLQRAKTEMKDADEPGIFDHVIVNENLEKAYECLKTALAKEGLVPSSADSAKS